jgi:hypothetical protein
MVTPREPFKPGSALHRAQRTLESLALAATHRAREERRPHAAVMANLKQGIQEKAPKEYASSRMGFYSRLSEKSQDHQETVLEVILGALRERDSTKERLARLKARRRVERRKQLKRQAQLVRDYQRDQRESTGGLVEPVALRLDPLDPYGPLPESEFPGSNHRPPDRWRQRLICRLYVLLEARDGEEPARSARTTEAKGRQSKVARADKSGAWRQHETYRAISNVLRWFFGFDVCQGAVKRFVDRNRKA